MVERKDKLVKGHNVYSKPGHSVKNKQRLPQKDMCIDMTPQFAHRIPNTLLSGGVKQDVTRLQDEQIIRPCSNVE